jgi:hypothetical protein
MKFLLLQARKSVFATALNDIAGDAVCQKLIPKQYLQNSYFLNHVPYFLRRGFDKIIFQWRTIIK